MIGMLGGLILIILLLFMGLADGVPLAVNLSSYRIITSEDMTFLVSSIEIIQNPTGSIKRAYELIKSSEEEVLRIFSSIHAFRRQVRLGIMHLFKDSVERGVSVRILIPADQNEIIQIVNEVNLVLPQLDIRSVDKSLESTVGILVVDRKESLIIETRDDSKDNSYDAAGLAAYSNSKPITLAYASIFESLETD
jgi:hypothetical protein